MMSCACGRMKPLQRRCADRIVHFLQCAASFRSASPLCVMTRRKGKRETGFLRSQNWHSFRPSPSALDGRERRFAAALVLPPRCFCARPNGPSPGSMVPFATSWLYCASASACKPFVLDVTFKPARVQLIRQILHTYVHRSTWRSSKPA